MDLLLDLLDLHGSPTRDLQGISMISIIDLLVDPAGSMDFLLVSTEY